MEEHDWVQRQVLNPKVTVHICSRCKLKRLWNGMNQTWTYGIESIPQGYGFSKIYDREISCSEMQMRMVLDNG